MRKNTTSSVNSVLSTTIHKLISRAGAAKTASALAFVVVAASQASAAFTVAGPTNHVASVPLTGFTAPWNATSVLDPDPVTKIGVPALGSNFFTTFAGDAPAEFAGWTAVRGGELAGTLSIKDYQAKDLGGRKGGARMDATYAPGVGESGFNLRWVQMFNSSLSGRHIDPKPNDDTQPFYYTDAEFGVAGLNFVDNPSLGPLPNAAFSYSVTFDLFLVSADITNKKVTVHDGIRWGYKLNVVPGPSALASFGGLLMLSGARRRRSS